MPQVSLYVDDALMKTLRAGAELEGVSLSRHVAVQLDSRQSGSMPRSDTVSGMPDGFFERLYGCIDDDTFKRPEQPDYAMDSLRSGFGQIE